MIEELKTIIRDIDPTGIAEEIKQVCQGCPCPDECARCFTSCAIDAVLCILNWKMEALDELQWVWEPAMVITGMGINNGSID